MGAGTGRRMGPCYGGVGRGFGRGFGCRRFFTGKEELELLKEEAKILEEDLRAIREIISEAEKPE